MAGHWAFVAADTDGNALGDLSEARSRRVTVRLRDAADVGFTISGRDEQALLVAELASDLLVYREGRLLFRGRVGASGDRISANTHSVSFDAQDYRALLRRRILYVDKSYSQVDEEAIGWDLIDYAQGQAYRDVVLGDGPVGYWRLGESSGTTAVDASGNGHDLTHDAGVTTGVAGALVGDDDAAAEYHRANSENSEVPTPPEMTSVGVSMEIWALVTADSHGAFLKVGGGSDGYGFGLGDGSFETAGATFLALYEGVRWINSGVVLSEGWRHCALVVASDGAALMYVDGSLVHTSAGSAPREPTGDVSVGGYTVSGINRHFDGSLDEPAVYDRALTADEIKRHYEAGRNTGGRRLGITRAGYATGTLRDRTYTAGKNIGEALDQLTEVIGGPDIEIGPDLVWRAWPRRGVDKGVVLAYGENVASLTRDVQPGDFANAVRVTGKGTEDGVTHTTPEVREAANLPTAPEGRFDLQSGDPDITTQSTLAAKADGLLAEHGVVRPGYTLTLTEGAWEGPDQLWLGDTVRLQIDSGRLQVDTQLRVYEIDLEPGDDGGETISVRLGRPRTRPTLADRRRLTGLESAVADLNRR